jgi:hypothetical protein
MKKSFFLLFLTTLTPAGLCAEADWTIVMVKQACCDLQSYMYRNIKDMMKVGSTQSVNILLELHKPGDTFWRYRIEKGFCSIEGKGIRSHQSSMEDEVKETMDWAVNAYPAKNYGLILSSHGSGPYDIESSPAYRSTSTRSTKSRHCEITQDRGILFDDERQKYLSLKQLKGALSTICTNTLKGKRLAFLGMDSCYMAMIEVLYEIKDYADHFVGSQEYELAQGWGYEGIIKDLVQNTRTPEEVCKTIVRKFEDRYKNTTSYYTQSHVELKHINTIKNSLDTVVALLAACKKDDPQTVRTLIQQARCQTMSFSVPDFVDLVSFYDEISKVFMPLQKTYEAGGMIAQSDQIRTLIVAVEEGKKQIQDAVLTNSRGRYLHRAHGVSIYFPLRATDETCLKTSFAEESQWVPFLSDHLQHKQPTTSRRF